MEPRAPTIAPTVGFAHLAAGARAAAAAGHWSESSELLRGAFDAEPRAWWLAMERIRALGHLHAASEKATRRDAAGAHVVFAPDYTGGNSYQRNLYSAAAECDYQVHSDKAMDLETVAALIAQGARIVFHQHWVKEIYWSATSFDDGVVRIDRALSLMKAYKSFGAQIVWTLHNLLDHDASETQVRLCRYAHAQLAATADRIYVHTLESVKLLSEQCGQDLASKCFLLEHPLYDDLLQGTGSTRTGITDDLPADARVLLCLGMIRPYKAVPDLIDAFGIFRREHAGAKVVLVIAGSLHDPLVRERLQALPPEVARHVKLIPRRIQDAEVVDLMTRADAAVLPYRQILISGSYYLATTFGKPVLAPARGMFVEKIEHGRTGLLYDGTVDDLARGIATIAGMPVRELADIGTRARRAAEHLTVRTTSRTFFASLGAPIHA